MLCEGKPHRNQIGRSTATLESDTFAMGLLLQALQDSLTSELMASCAPSLGNGQRELVDVTGIEPVTHLLAKIGCTKNQYVTRNKGGLLPNATSTTLTGVYLRWADTR
jgi:hypothetical protein